MQSSFVFWAWWGGYYWEKHVSFAFVLYIPEKRSGWSCALTIFFLLWYFDLLARNGRLDVDLVHHPACCPALQMLPAKEVYGAKAERLKCFSPSLCGGEENRCGVGSLWLSNHNNFNLGYNDWKTDFIRSFETKRLERELSSLINFGSWFFHSPHPPKIISLVSVNVMAAAGLNESVLKQCHPLLCDEKLARGACRSRGGGHVPAIYLILLPSWLRLASCVFKLSGCICIHLLLEWIFGISPCDWLRCRGNEHFCVQKPLFLSFETKIECFAMNICQQCP